MIKKKKKNYGKWILKEYIFGNKYNVLLLTKAAWEIALAFSVFDF